MTFLLLTSTKDDSKILVNLALVFEASRRSRYCTSLATKDGNSVYVRETPEDISAMLLGTREEALAISAARSISDSEDRALRLVEERQRFGAKLREFGVPEDIIVKSTDEYQLEDKSYEDDPERVGRADPPTKRKTAERVAALAPSKSGWHASGFRNAWPGGLKYEEPALEEPRYARRATSASRAFRAAFASIIASCAACRSPA
jgi:hypothetical protein